MQSFLNKIAKKAIEDFPTNLDELTIVLPNRRAIVFLKNEFKNCLKGTNWLPQFYSLEDFIFNLSEFSNIDQIDLVFELYEVHKQIEKDNAESFSEFLNWSSTMLYDFNEIDRYLVDPVELFGYLTEAKALETWNIGGEELTDFQKNYLRFWQQLGTYYQLFEKRLIAQGKVYQGLAFRRVAENLLSNSDEITNDNYLYFCGFNALTEAEYEVITYFEKKGVASIFWDADEYYLNDKDQEAGLFLRKYKESSKKEFNWVGNAWANTAKNINIYGISGDAGQAKLIANLLKNYAQSASLENTAIVMAEESLLLPVLESLPPMVKSSNVTMGYPLSLSVFFSWFESFFSTHRSTEISEKLTNTSQLFYHKELKGFLEGTAIQFFENDTKQKIKTFLKEINEQKLIYLEAEKLEKVNSIFGISLFENQLFTNFSLIQSCLELINRLKQLPKVKANKVELEFLFHFHKLFNRLKEADGNFLQGSDIDAFIQLFKQVLRNESLSFIGEPLGGLQIMGVLESRTLGFDNLIISSVNEGVLPSGKSQNSFIPFDIKRKFNLPSYKEKDAIFAYHFYRLLQTAKNVSIIYNTKTDALKGGERSRFIEQLIIEAPQKTSNLLIKEQTIAPPFTSPAANEKQLILDDQIRQKMEEHLSHGLSVSAINTFLSCPLDYYYKYVLRLKEKEDSIEEIESNTFGTIVHNTLEHIYTPFISLKLDQAAIVQLKKSVDNELLVQFRNELKVNPTHGVHKLNVEVAKVFVNKMIDIDAAEVKAGNEVVVMALEENFKVNTEIQLNGKVRSVTLKGKIDRVDAFNGQKRIIDYKTGGITADELNFRDMDAILKGGKPKVIQLLIYNLAYSLKHLENNALTGMISLKNSSQGFMTLKKPISKEEESAFLEGFLQQFLNELEVFEHDSAAKYCAFCQ